MATSYYVRIQGRILGPFAPDQLRAMKSRGQLHKFHEISTDKENWYPASDFTDLFPDFVPPFQQSAATASSNTDQDSDLSNYSPDYRNDNYYPRRRWSNLSPIWLFAVIGLILCIVAGLVIYANLGDDNAPRHRQNRIDDLIGGLSVMACVGIVFVGLIVLHILIMIWIVRDARNRSLEGEVLWLIAALLFGIVVWIIYLASRPPGTLVECDRCNNQRLIYVKICPHCRWETEPEAR